MVPLEGDGVGCDVVTLLREAATFVPSASSHVYLKL